MHEYFAYFLKELAPQSHTVMPSAAQIDAYRGALPDALLTFWAEAGWGAHADGLAWLVNPADYEAIAREWIEGISLPVDEPLHVIARSAFGRLFLRGKTSGQSVIVVPTYSRVITSPPDKYLARGEEEFAITSQFVAFSADAFDMDDIKDKPLFKRALKKLGRLQPVEMYGFEPALALGGVPDLGKLAKVSLAEHLALLRQLDDVEVLHIDVSGR